MSWQGGPTYYQGFYKHNALFILQFSIFICILCVNSLATITLPRQWLPPNAINLHCLRELSDYHHLIFCHFTFPIHRRFPTNSLFNVRRKSFINAGFHVRRGEPTISGASFLQGRTIPAGLHATASEEFFHFLLTSFARHLSFPLARASQPDILVMMVEWWPLTQVWCVDPSTFLPFRSAVFLLL